MPPSRLPPPRPDDWRDAAVLVVVAHPDDEVLGCGALLARLGPVRIVHVTDGAPREGADARRHGFEGPPDYAAARYREALAALALAGVGADQLTSLGYADQTVPQHLDGLARALRPLIAAVGIVLTHAYEGGHGDHDAVAFAVHAARAMSGGAAQLVEMPFYHGDDRGWVRQRFADRAEAETVVLTLGPAERALKARMLAAHASQAETLGGFAPDAERFRFAAPTDFLRRPHAGPLLYEVHGWSLTWEAWQRAVAAAQASLGLDR